MSFAENLKRARLAAGLSQARLAEASGVSLRAIQTWESGEKHPKSIEFVRRAADALGVATEELLGQSGQYVVSAYEKGGDEAAREIENLVNGVAALFAGGAGAPVLDQREKDGIMAVLNEVYWESKKENRESYQPKPYRMQSGPKAGK